MGLTRRERFARQRDREAIAAMGAGDIKIEVAAAFKCDHCGEAAGTLYNIGGKLICYADLPFEYVHGAKAGRLFGRAHSGKAAIEKIRKELARI